MRYVRPIIIASLLGVFFLSSCSETSNPVSTNEVVEEKQKEINEIGRQILPDDILESYTDVSDIPENEQVAYLDTLNNKVSAFRDSLLKYYSASDLQDAFTRFEEMSRKIKTENKLKNRSEVFDYIRLGYGKAAQISMGGESGFAAKIGASISSKGGGGIEIIYDFVNLDREIYTTSFCYLGGSVLIGAEVDPGSFEVGFTGINKWLLNINTREKENKFTGAARGFSFGISGEIQALLGISPGISFSKTQDVLATGGFQNADVCPSGFALTPDPAGVKEYSLEVSADVSSGPAGSLVLSLDGGVLGSYRTPVADTYTEFGAFKHRRIRALDMATEIILPSLAAGILTSSSVGFDLTAAVFAIMYGDMTYEDFESVRPEILVSPDLINAPSTYSSHKIAISNIGSGNLEWSISTESEWIEIDESTGNGSAEVEIGVLANNTGELRSGELIVFSNGGDEKKILIQQYNEDVESNITYRNFGITGDRYEDISNWDQIVEENFGSEYRVADWNDLKKYHADGGNILELFDGLNLTDYNESAFVTRSGDRNYSSSRYYFASRHEGNRPSNYLAHENINNYEISLGSWWGSRQIIVFKKGSD